MEIHFDSGTLLFDTLPSGVGVGDLPDTVWDARVSAYRAPAFRHAVLRAAFARAGALFVDTVRAPPMDLGKFAGLHLRPHQDDALAAWQGRQERGVIVLPTGAGKTRVAMAAMASRPRSTLVLVPTRALMEQWLVGLRKVYDGPLGRLGDGSHEVRGVTVATFEMAYRAMARIGNAFELLVVDEAHHFGAGIRDEALEMCVAPARLGLTATPPARADTIDGLKRLLGEVVHEKRLRDLSSGVLAAFDVVTCPVGLLPDEKRRYDALVRPFLEAQRRFRASGGGSWSELVTFVLRGEGGARTIADWHRARREVSNCAAKHDAIEALLAQHRLARSRVLLFTADNDTAYAIASRHLIMPITCDIGRAERIDALARFSRGELNALVSAKVLNEGIDVPEADVAIVVGGAGGEREHVQRIGRVLRAAPGKRARVYELVAKGTFEAAQARRRREGLGASKRSA